MDTNETKTDTDLKDEAKYEHLIKKMLDIIKEKSNEKDSSIKEAIMMAISEFEE